MQATTTKSIAKASGGLVGLLALLAALIAANVIVGNVRLRGDLTEEKLYSLSDGSRNLLKKMDRDVTLKLFFNASAPEVPVFLKNYARQVEDLLKEYRLAAGGRIAIEKFDPKPDSDAEEWAQRYGLSPQSVGMLGGPNIYFGLVAVAGDTEGAIPVFDPRAEQLLEYNITRLIHRACHPERPKVGVMSTLPALGMNMPQFAMPGQPRPPNQPAWFAFQELRKDFDVQEVPPSSDEIPPEIEALVLVHPKDASDKTQYALDQFVLRGGRLLVFVDPFSITDMEGQPQQNMFGIGQQTSSDLPKLFKAWGVGYDPAKVLADPRAITRVRGNGNRIEESPVLLSYTKANLNRTDVLTTQLGQLLFPFAGSLKDDTSDQVDFVALVSSSDSAGDVDSVSARFGSQAIRSQFKSKGTSSVIAARLTGNFRTAFPDGRPKEADDKKEGDAASKPVADPKAGHLAEGKSTIVVVADADLLVDRFCVEAMNFFGATAHRPLNDNINLLANTVEQIAGSSDLIGIRSRGEFNRPFDKVVKLEEQARLVWQTKEDELSKQLEEAQRKINELQAEKDQSQRFIMSDKQREAIANFRKEEIRIKRDLKDVRKNLRRDVERLGVQVKVANIALMPLLVSLGGISYGLWRRRR
jgi:ABC-type uncharacterized transport system involved in gliding motility auxiliary subunit